MAIKKRETETGSESKGLNFFFIFNSVVSSLLIGPNPQKISNNPRYEMGFIALSTVVFTPYGTNAIPSGGPFRRAIQLDRTLLTLSRKFFFSLCPFLLSLLSFPLQDPATRIESGGNNRYDDPMTIVDLIVDIM